MERKNRGIAQLQLSFEKGELTFYRLAAIQKHCQSVLIGSGFRGWRWFDVFHIDWPHNNSSERIMKGVYENRENKLL